MDYALAEFVRQRAVWCCEYCRLPERFSTSPFEIDHVIAEQHRGRTVASNLALACFADNHYKGPNLASIDPKTGKRVWLFNPRRAPHLSDGGQQQGHQGGNDADDHEKLDQSNGPTVTK